MLNSRAYEAAVKNRVDKHLLPNFIYEISYLGKTAKASYLGLFYFFARDVKIDKLICLGIRFFSETLKVDGLLNYFMSKKAL